MRFKKLISAFLAAAFCVSLAGMAFAEKLTKVPTAWTVSYTHLTLPTILRV